MQNVEIGVVMVIHGHWQNNHSIEHIWFPIRFQQKPCVYLLPFSSYRKLLSKVVDFNLPHLHLVPPLGVTLFKFCQDLWHHKLESLGYHVVFVIPHLAIFRQHRCMMNRGTDRWRQHMRY